MELVKQLRDLFSNKPVVVPPAPLYSDEDFLEFVAAQARKRTLDAQKTQAKKEGDSAQLGTAA
jgi:hypothetical protein